MNSRPDGHACEARGLRELWKLKRSLLRQGAKRLLFGQVETETETTPGLLIPAGG